MKDKYQEPVCTPNTSGEGVSNYDFRPDYNNLITRIGEFRVRHMPYVIELDGVIYTWTDLGGDKRLAEWRVGKMRLDDKWAPLNGDLMERVMKEIEDGAISIMDYLREHYELPSTCTERTWAYLADKCAKTISFGATWVQVLRYVEKELDYLENHPRDEYGRRGTPKA